jgi:hypothetical protein
VATLTDPMLLQAYLKALEENLRYSGYVLWKPRAVEWIGMNLPGYTPKAISTLMHQHVAGGGEVDQVVERREEWLDFGFHYDLRFPVESRLLYIETIFFDDDPDPTIQVVNIHDA